MFNRNNSNYYKGEYIIKVKSIQAEYEMTRKFDFKLFVKPVLWGIVGIILCFLINFRDFYSLMNSNIPMDPKLNTININDAIRMSMLSGIGQIIIIFMIIGFTIVINDRLTGLRKIKIENNNLFIKKFNTDYKFSLEELINIRIGMLGPRNNIYRNYCLCIYYLKNNEINEFKVSFSRQNLEKIKEFCSMFITNMNNEEIDLNQYLDVRTKEQDELIKRVLNDEIIW